MNTNYSYVVRELEKAGYLTDPAYGDALSTTVTKMLAVLDAEELGAYDRTVVASLIRNLVEGDASLNCPADERSSWIPFVLGVTPYQTVVRVKKTAYSTAGGIKHNGLVGIYVSARGGRPYIQYFGHTQTGGFAHDPALLEALVKPNGS